MTRSGVIVKLSVPGSVAFRGRVLDMVERVCRKAIDHDFEPEVFVHQMVSAVGEAFNNIAIHAYNDTNRDEVEVEVCIDSTSVTATLRDFGIAFRPRQPQSLDMSRFGELELPESGMGMHIMRSFVDEVDYHPGSPNVLQLKKRLLATG